MPESNFPSSLDTDANSSLPKTISDTAALNNPNHAEMHGRSNDAIIEMQTKIGTGSSGTPTGTTQTAATGAVLIGTGSGASAWDTTPTFVGDVTIPEGDLILGSTAVTSTAAELNILDGCTATVSELNIMDGVTATTSELNILDGCTATAAEINVVDGVTSGTVTASKAVVVDGNKDIASFRNVTLTGELDAATLDLSSSADIAGSLTVGADGSGTDVIFYSETAGDNLTWDASEECLIITGTAGQLALDIAAGTVEFNGNFNVGEDGSGHDVRFYSSTAGDSFHWDSSDEKLVITGTNGQDALHVADGNVHIDDTLDIDGTIQAADGSSSAPTYTFSGDTDVGIYREADDTLAFAGKLFMSTALPQTSTGSYATLRRFSDGSIKELISSERFKKDITDVALSDAYNILDARPIHYRDINDDSSDPVQAGLSAESLHDSGWTYAVTYDEDTTTPKGINYEMLVAPLIAIVKDLNNRLETLEG